MGAVGIRSVAGGRVGGSGGGRVCCSSGDLWAVGPARRRQVHHHGHYWYHGGWGPAVLPPRVYLSPAPMVVVPAPIYPVPVYPPVYRAPGDLYYGYPQGYIHTGLGGVSLGIGL